MTIRRTVPIQSGYNHRTHRSSKNRSKKILKERKSANMHILKKKDEMILDKLFGPVENIKARAVDMPKKPVKPAEKLVKPAVTFPKLLCQSCGYSNQLNFNPLKLEVLLEEVICENCKRHAYWTFYFKIEEMLGLNFIYWHWLRDFIKQNKIQLVC